MHMFKLFKKKNITEEKIEERDYSIREILSMTKSAQDKNEERKRQAQKKYYKELDAKIARAARRGETKIITASIDNFIDEYDFITCEFLREIQRVYSAKGYKTEYVQPIEDDPIHAWVRISWEDRLR